MLSARIKECLAMAMIGDGVLAMIEPTRHTRLWESGPRWWRALVDPFLDRPALMRAIGAGETALGIWLATRQGAKSLG